MRFFAPVLAGTLLATGCSADRSSPPVLEPGSEAKTASVPLHVLTADYLGSPDGTRAVPWSAAAPYLTWAETGTTDASAIHAAGIETMLYVDPNREQVGSQMYTTDEAAYAHGCDGKRVTDDYQGVTQFVTNPASPVMQSIYSKYVANVAATAKFDALFEDDSGVLEAFAPYDPFNELPCAYTDASWIASEILLDDVPSIPVVVNGLSGLHNKGPSLALGLLAGTNVAGGVFEQCYDSTSQPKMVSWLWQAIEDTELAVAATHKRFDCMGTATTPGASSTDVRLYAYASYLLTYDPGTTVYRSLFSTTTGLHVFPETEFVPTQPLLTDPLTVELLQTADGVYARLYAACYLRAKIVGPCAIVVNSTRDSKRFPFHGYKHTLVLRGGGVLDGGSVSVAGPPPPAILEPAEAVIAFR